GQLIRQFEAVSPNTKSSSISNLSSLDLGRVDPVALVLTNGRILVGGGYMPSGDADAPGGAAVGQIEAFSADARSRVFRAELPARTNRTFAALPGGGALSVASCRNEPAPLRTDCSCVTSEGTTCTSANSNQAWLDAWWIDPSGTPTPVAFETNGVLAPCATVDTPLLAAGSDGAPWLAFPNADGTPACLWRFEAWPAVADANDPASRPRFVMTTRTLDPSPDPRSSLLSLGPDAFEWVGTNGGLFGARFGQRGPLSRDFSLLLSLDTPFRPAHLVPDRDATRPPSGSNSPPVAFERVGSRLTLTPVEPSVTIWATDTLYDGVALSLEVEPPSDGSAPALPLLVFQSPTGATATCAWNPPPLGAASTPITVTASRNDTRATLSAPDVADTTCDVPPGSLAVGTRAGSGTVTLGELELSRLLLE
ncbi:MAG TPA: hypothetical protein VLJ38_00520, partial [Polyangiaceae bacterium]|nr:hypothetical protein [Polyangiaceae bacterium]